MADALQALDQLQAVLQALGEAGQRVFGSLAQLTAGLGQQLGIVAIQIAGTVASVAGATTRSLATALQIVGSIAGGTLKLVGTVASATLNLLGTVAAKLPSLSTILGAIGTAAQTAAGFVSALTSGIAGMAGVLGAVAAQIPGVGALFAGIKDIVADIATELTKTSQQIAEWVAKVPGLATAFKAVGAAVASAAGTIAGVLSSAVTGLLSKIPGLGTVFQTAGSIIKTAFQTLGTAVTGISGALAAVINQIPNLGSAFKTAGTWIANAAVNLGALFLKIPGVSGAISLLGTAFTTAGKVALIAFQGVAGLLDSLVGLSNRLFGLVTVGFAGLVQLAAPAVFMQFTLAVRDLGAALGTLLAPVVQAFTGILRQLNAWITNLSPATRAWITAFAGGIAIFVAAGKALGLLAGILSGGLFPILGVIAAALVGASEGFGGMTDDAGALGQTLAQLRETFAGVWQTFQTALAALGEAFGAVFEAAQPFVQFLIEGLAAGIKIVLGLVTQLLVVIAVLAKRLKEGRLLDGGLFDEIAAKLNEIERRRSGPRPQGETHAAQNASTQGLEEASRKLQAAAFGGGVNTIAQQTLEAAKRSAKANESLFEEMKNHIANIAGPVGKVVEKVLTKLNEWLDWAKAKFNNMRHWFS